MKQRIEWLDSLRGFAIFLVALGHNSIQPWIFAYIYSFHMPLFFFLSGFLFSADKYPTFLSFLKRKAQTLLVPYFLFSAVIYAYWLIVIEKIWLNPGHWLQPIINVFYSSTHLEGIFQPLWFLPCLFLTEILFYLIYKYIKNYYFLIALGLSLIGWLVSLKFPSLPWNMGTTLVVLFFYSLGFMLKTSRILEKGWKPSYWLAVLVLMFMANIAYLTWNGMPDLLFSHYQNFLFFLWSALCGIGAYLLIFYLSRDKNWWILKVLKFWGQNSLIIFAFHPIGILLAKKIVAVFSTISSVPIPDQQSVLFGALYSILAILIITPLFFVYNRLFAKRPQKI